MAHAAWSALRVLATRRRDCFGAGLVAGALLLAPVNSAQTTERVLRIATFNASLYRPTKGELARDLAATNNAQAQAVAAIIQTVRPDILLINEFDYDAASRSAKLFRANYLERPQNGTEPIQYAHSFVASVNTGVPSGTDLNRDGKVAGGEDAFGFGAFEGQYGMVLYSRFPIDRPAVRTFQRFLWRDLPNALLPDDPATPAPNDWYSARQLAKLRLSSKSHWDVPLRIGNLILHVLASHPTPPAFDGPEDRNGTRNHDEIRFWSDYLSGDQANYLYDDRGARGGLRGEHFVILGDLNSDPLDGSSRHVAIRALLAHPRVSRGPTPESVGAVEASRIQGEANNSHLGDPRFDTADFNDRGVGNLRVDYVLPSRSMRVCASGVFWPRAADPASRLTGQGPNQTSDHRLVWVDVSLDGRCSPRPQPADDARPAARARQRSSSSMPTGQ